MRLSEHKTYDCAPTLNDTQVLDFCKNGYLLLEGVVPDEINQRTTKYLDGDDFYEPTGILEQDWFVENVTLNPAAAGAVRALLGAGAHLDGHAHEQRPVLGIRAFRDRRA